ncbi:MAG TPA: hypothetical protein VFT42_10220 [Solirubrobacteraceae bacterium]|nr:hypothetical protein [Solirubrobacteraceae bacterium]
MTRKSIVTNGPVVSCDVCGRTLLRGEHADTFLHGGARRNVCELCTARAANEGWIRDGLDGATVRSSGRGRSRRGREGSLLGRLKARREAAREVQDEPWAEPPEPVFDEEGWAVQPEAEPQLEPEPQPEPAAPVPQEPLYEQPYEPRTVHAVPTNADLKMARALEVFNANGHRRTVSGVARSLGAPIVCVRPSETEGSVVLITVAWELSWYRFEVDLGNEAAGVRIVAQGAELSELEPAEQEPNAAADEHGGLHLAAQHA